MLRLPLPSFDVFDDHVYGKARDVRLTEGEYVCLDIVISLTAAQTISERLAAAL
jgi:hypothetical protein